ncbi:hypothetical protein AEA09_17040 [Lysinibacillus contaminans]|uniref:DUF2804 domain-containing protein n=1 Tax=Lysinibacillus contaminans TaxID=1293441 RepID=A0ABR5JWB8_9BACI|nr:DUF2804 domain-containing protein [Lysinibacillus contaminans]KOS66452.1 hypothetical protein AEA09_17040 [Lysinibacillus contaminans]
MKQHAEKEILLPTLLCDKKGNLNPAAIGFARKPFINSNLTGHMMRKKKWNYWCVYGDEILFSATISHLDYAAVCFVYFLEYETQRYFEKTITIPLGGKLKMPTQVLETVTFNNSEMAIDITYIQNETHLVVSIPNFDGDVLRADLVIQHPLADESLNVVIPWNRKTFQFTGKHHILPTSGLVTIGDRRFTFTPEESFAVLDYGRGVWPRQATWNWGMASQRVRGRRIGLNLGGKWTDGTGMTENAVFVDGKMTKIHEDVLIEYDREDFMQPWYVKSKFSNQVELKFSPFFERVATSNAKLIKSEVHQMFGYYDGKVLLDNGETLVIQQMLGSIEEHIAKW